MSSSKKPRRASRPPEAVVEEEEEEDEEEDEEGEEEEEEEEEEEAPRPKKKAKSSKESNDEEVIIVGTTTKFHKAAKAGDWGSVHKLLKDPRTNIDARDGEMGSTALLLACLHPHMDVCRLLVSKGANPNLANIEHDTPLLVASRGGSFVVGEDLNEENSSVQRHKKLNGALVRLLLDKNANPNVRSTFDQHQTPLCAAVYFCYKTHEETHLQLLLEHPSTQVDLPDGLSHSTPLAYAAYYGIEISALLLMRKGAKANHKDRNGVTPIDEATKLRDRAMLAILKNKARS